MNFKFTKTCIASLLALFAVTSCAVGYDDDERFSGGVSNAQLQSPELSADCFATITNPDGSESVKFTWPLVMGAGGYLCNVAVVDDPTSPEYLITDSVVDGCSVIFERREDTKYSVSVKTLGNPKYNNAEATETSEFAYSTLVPALTIPAGTEISRFIAENLAAADGELGFELLAGETYALDGTADFGLNTVTFRGSKANRPTVVVGPQGRISTQAGLKIKFINFDCSGSNEGGLLVLPDSPDPSISTEALGYKAVGANQDGWVINDPVMFQECYVKGLKTSLLYGNKTNWSLRDFRINDCIVQLNNSSSSSVINLYGASNGLIKDMRIENSTFYNLVENSSAYFLRYSNSSNAQPQKIFGSNDATTSHTVSHCTFSRTFTNKDFANMMPTVATFSITVDHSIFYDVFRLYQYFANNTTKKTEYNSICGANGGAPDNNDLSRRDSNDQPLAIQDDPQFVGPFTQELDFTKENGGVNFRPTSPYATQNKIGDPRWFE